MTIRLIYLTSLCLCGSVAIAQDRERLAIPKQSELEEVEGVVREVFGEAIKNATTSPQKVALAESLIQQADQASDDPAAKYFLLTKAMETGAGSGDVAIAFEAAEQLTATYKLVPLEVHSELILAIAKFARTTAQRLAIVERAMRITKNAVAADDFIIAQKTGQTALTVARQLKNADLIRSIISRNKAVRILAAAYESVREAEEKLVQSPTDSSANLIVGSYHCFTKGDWGAGLPRLAISNDGKLKELARSELKPPESLKERLALGDAWWTLASNSGNDIQKAAMEGRGAYWYQQVINSPEVKGLTKAKLQKRLAKVEEENNLATSGFAPDPAANSNLLSLLGKGEFSKDYLKAGSVEFPSGRWQKGKGFITGVRIPMLLKLPSIGEKYSIQIRMAIGPLNGTACQIRFLDAQKGIVAKLGFDGDSDHRIFSGVYKYEVPHGRTEEFLDAGKPFTLEIARDGVSFTYSIDGKEVSKRNVREGASLPYLQFWPNRGALRIYDVSVVKD